MLIKSVLQALPVYVMGIFKLPDSVCEDLSKAVRKFWWGAGDGKRRTHWRAWDSLTKPKQCGGMGFRDFRLFNQALLARQSWRILEFPESLCARVLKAKYFPNGSLIDTSFSGNASPGWRGIEYGLELLKQGIIWRVGNGRTIRIWRDPWIPRDFSRRPITHRGTSRVKWVSELLDQNGEWDSHKIQQIFLPIDVEKILSIRTSRFHENDFVAWHSDKLGRFSVRSAYHLALSLSNVVASSSSSGQELSKAWNQLWSCHVPQKVRIFIWRAASNSLATMVNKKKRRLEHSSMCSICGTEEEDVAHALCRCPHAKYLWEVMRRAKAITVQADRNWTGADWIFDISERISKEERPTLLMMLWRIWYVRNEITHGKAAVPAEVSQRFISSYITSLLEIRQFPDANLCKGKHVIQCAAAGAQVNHPRVNSVPVRWVRPQAGWMKLNVDGSYDPRDGSGGIGAVLRNSEGKLIFAACGSMCRPVSALEAELVACKEGIILALQWTFLPIIVETDCLELVKLVGEQGKVMSDLAFLIREIKDLVKGNREIVINKVTRSRSIDCHFLANKGRCESLTAFWPDDRCNLIPHTSGVDE